MIEEQYQRAIQILSDNKDKLTSLAHKLLEKEVIFKEDLIEIFGERPWDISPSEKIEERAAESGSNITKTSEDASANDGNSVLTNEQNKDADETKKLDSENLS